MVHDDLFVGTTICWPERSQSAWVPPTLGFSSQVHLMGKGAGSLGKHTEMLDHGL